MRRISILLVVFSLAALGARAQTVTGSGTTNKIAKFTGSSTAMKGTDRGKMLGAVVGKALEPLREGTGVIQVLVTLQ